MRKVTPAGRPHAADRPALLGLPGERATVARASPGVPETLWALFPPRGGTALRTDFWENQHPQHCFKATTLRSQRRLLSLVCHPEAGWPPARKPALCSGAVDTGTAQQVPSQERGVVPPKASSGDGGLRAGQPGKGTDSRSQPTGEHSLRTAHHGAGLSGLLPTNTPTTGCAPGREPSPQPSLQSTFRMEGAPGTDGEQGGVTARPGADPAGRTQA